MSRAELVVLTQNQHKLAEISPLFQEYGIHFETTSMPKYEIRADSVEEVARVAAEYAYRTLMRPLVTDDTGLFIRALNGFPQTYPAFVLSTIGTGGILKILEGVEDRSAKFVTAVGYCDENGLRSFVGEMEGTIALTQAGSGGFGYDPIFIPRGESRTYAQLSLEEKVAISHRTKAFRSFLDWYSRERMRQPAERC
ncbi:MAG: XTP/dITP diphosphatase [Candidatus Thorarchaeota archaeon]|nr:XTP/dITP diphosphatase [Candidatus Thorarchaeota archaeon]